MIYAYIGNDFNVAIRKARELLFNLSKKRPDASIVYIDGNSFNESKWEFYIGSQGLFIEKTLIFGNRILENKEHRKFFEKHIKEISNSKNIFIFAEESVPEKLFEKLEKFSEKVVRYSKKQNKNIINNVYNSNLFNITDAIGRRDKNRFFIEYERAILARASAEEIYSLVYWQVKSMLLVKLLKDSEPKAISDIGMKPYTFKKSKMFSENYSEKELKNMLNKLTALFHDSRFNEENMELGILDIVLRV